MSYSIIAAIGKKYELGKKGGLCFEIPGDLSYFKKTTRGGVDEPNYREVVETHPHSPATIYYSMLA